MGQGMARKLLETGFDLVVCNRSPAKAQPLVDAGAALAFTAREAAAGADFVVAMVGNDDDSREVWLGTDSVLAGGPNPGAIAIESSTLSFGWVRELAETLTAAGLRFVDCPVTGGRQAAESGTLTLLVGASDQDLIAARPVLEAYSQKIVHFGAPGAGTAYKLAVNLLVGVQAAALGEILVLANSAGLPMEQVVQCLASSPAASPIVQAYAARMVNGEHGEPIQFLERWMHKDMVYGVRLAADMGQAAPTCAIAAQVHQMAMSRGMGDRNVTAVIEALRQP